MKQGFSQFSNEENVRLHLSEICICSSYLLCFCVCDTSKVSIILLLRKFFGNYFKNSFERMLYTKFSVTCRVGSQTPKPYALASNITKIEKKVGTSKRNTNFFSETSKSH